MKKKILNHIKIIIIILIGVTILFAILGTFKGLKENMEDVDVPQCYSDFKSDVPCYADTDVLASNDTDSEHAKYSENKDDKYILKTKIIPPKGTSCPIEISSPASKYLNGITPDNDSGTGAAGVGSTQIQNSSNSNSSITSSSSTNITNIGGSGESNKNTDSATPVAAESASSTPSPVSNDAIIQNTAALNEIKGSITQINQQKPKPETCPPCPACERCPEPAFDCKKVPNYRSPSIGQYLPMPILNDFSTF
jgi:hypothetical protein